MFYVIKGEQFKSAEKVVGVYETDFTAKANCPDDCYVSGDEGDMRTDYIDACRLLRNTVNRIAARAEEGKTCNAFRAFVPEASLLIMYIGNELQKQKRTSA